MTYSILGKASGLAEVHALPVHALPVHASFSITMPTASLSSTLASPPVGLSDTLTAHQVVDFTKPSMVVVTEGIPPVPCQLVERVRKWECINMADLLGDHSPDHLAIINGQVTAVTSAGITKNPLQILTYYSGCKLSTSSQPF